MQRAGKVERETELADDAEGDGVGHDFLCSRPSMMARSQAIHAA